jgi:membrane fusion protein (multidrug efflux system)
MSRLGQPGGFGRSHLALAADPFGAWLVRLAVTLGFVGLWSLWFARAELAVYEVTDRARIEAAAAVHPVDTPVAGRLVAVHVRLGEEVAAGAPLFDLDAEDQRLELAEVDARLVPQRTQLAAVEREIELVDRLRRERDETADRQLLAIRAQHEVEKITGRYAESEDRRAERLYELGLLSEEARLRYLGEVEKSGARSRAGEAELATLASQQRDDATDLATRAAHLDHERTALTGEVRSLAARVERLRREIAERRITAPVAGRVGRLADLRAGAVVTPGQRLAEVVPAGALRAVAWFPPSSLGRLRPGQTAWLRLDAYPWSEYGTVEATLERVADEPVDGRLRAELTLAEPDRARLPLRHGLTATAEVAVERLTPARWVLRAAGGPFRPAAAPGR